MGKAEKITADYCQGNAQGIHPPGSDNLNVHFLTGNMTIQPHG